MNEYNDSGLWTTKVFPFFNNLIDVIVKLVRLFKLIILHKPALKYMFCITNLC